MILKWPLGISKDKLLLFHILQKSQKPKILCFESDDIPYS